VRFPVSVFGLTHEIRSHAMNGGSVSDAQAHSMDLGSVWDATDEMWECLFALPGTEQGGFTAEIPDQAQRISPCCPLLQTMEIAVFVRIKTMEHAFSTGRAAPTLFSMRFRCVVSC